MTAVFIVHYNSLVDRHGTTSSKYHAKVSQSKALTVTDSNGS